MTDSLGAAKHSLVQKSGICLLTIELPQLCAHQGLCVKCLVLTSPCSFMFLCSTHGVSKTPEITDSIPFLQPSFSNHISSQTQFQRRISVSHCRKAYRINRIPRKCISITSQKNIQNKRDSCSLHGQDNLIEFILAIIVHILKHIKHLCHQNCTASFSYSNGSMCTTVL